MNAANGIFLVASGGDDDRAVHALITMLKGPSNQDTRIIYFSIVRTVLVNQKLISPKTPLVFYIQDPSSLWIFDNDQSADSSYDKKLIVNCMYAIRDVALRTQNSYVVLSDAPAEAAPPSSLLPKMTLKIITATGRIDVVNGPFKNLIRQDSVVPPKMIKSPLVNIMIEFN